MANYPYIIASFPDLVLDDEKHPVDEQAVIAEVKGQLSEKDGQLVDWLEFGLEGSHLKSHFYRNIRQSGCRFLIDWFEFDRQLRLSRLRARPLHGRRAGRHAGHTRLRLGHRHVHGGESPQRHQSGPMHD